jgi:hypothetical protein
MYNLTVDEAHPFFVGDGAWLVHNCADVVTKDFAHATSPENADNIINNGLDQNAATTASKGGRVNRPGSFFTVEVTPETFTSIAEDLVAFARRQSEKPVVVIVQIPERIFQQFKKAGTVATRKWGDYNETIFSPATFPTINQGIKDGTISIIVNDTFKG